MSEELMENGVPQCEDQITGSEVQGEEKPDLSQGSQEESETTSASKDEVVDLSELAAEDGEFGKANVRQAQPFTVRLKVTQSALVVTVKRVENDNTQTFYIPVRW